ncbi:thioredoxin-like reductase Rv2466c [Clavibacter sp.]|nr:thioredoxin-like reductase Rv2466c [Clavibacter sp.]
MSKSNVQFWFDPICPWAFMTSRWLLEVEKIRDISITWNLFSLAHLNKDKDLAPEYRARLIRSWQATRVIAAAQEKNGKEITLPLYTAISSRIHLKKMEVGKELFTQALKEVGADENLASAESDSKFDNAIIASHEAGIALVGSDVGTPIIAVEGTAFLVRSFLLLQREKRLESYGMEYYLQQVIQDFLKLREAGPLVLS